MECLRKMALQLFEVFTGDWAICNFVAVAVTGGAALLALLLLLRGEVRQKALRRPPLQANDMKRVCGGVAASRPQKRTCGTGFGFGKLEVFRTFRVCDAAGVTVTGCAEAWDVLF
jgi:hypothetical protein